MAKKQVLQIKDFSGGVNSYSDPRDLKENEFQILDNAVVDEQGIIRVSGGLELKGNIDIEYTDYSSLSKPGSGLFSFLHDINIGQYVSMNSLLNMAGEDLNTAFGVEKSNVNGTWAFERTDTNSNETSNSSLNPPLNWGWVYPRWGAPSVFFAESYLTYAAKGNYNHGSLTFKSLNLTPGTTYTAYLKCMSENPWYYLGSNIPPRLRLYNETLGKYYYPDIGFSSISDETQSALLNDNMSNFLDTPTDDDDSAGSSHITYSGGETQGDGVWECKDRTGNFENSVVTRVQVTSTAISSTTVYADSNDTTLTVTTSGLAVGMHIVGAFIQDDTFIDTITSGSALEMTKAATGGSTASRTFYTPYNHKNFNAFFGGTSTSGNATNGFCLKLLSSASGGAFTDGNFMRSSEITVAANTTYLYDAFFHGCGETVGVGAVSVSMLIYDETNNADIDNSGVTATSGPKWKHINEASNGNMKAPKSVEFTTPVTCTSIRILVGVDNDASSPAEFAYFAGFNLRKKVNELTYLQGWSGLASLDSYYHNANSWNNDGTDGTVKNSQYVRDNWWDENFYDWWRRYKFEFTIPNDYDESNQWCLSLEAGTWGGVNQSGVSSFIVQSLELVDTTNSEGMIQYGGSKVSRGGNIITTNYEDNRTYLELYSLNSDNIYELNQNINLPSVDYKADFNFLNHGMKVYFCDSSFKNDLLYSLEQKETFMTVKKESFEGPSIDMFSNNTDIGGVNYNYSYDGLTGYMEDETTPTYNSTLLKIESSGFTGNADTDSFNEHSGISTETVNDADEASGSGLDSDLPGDEGDVVLKGFKYKSSGFVDDAHPYTKYIVFKDSNISNSSGGTDTSKLQYGTKLAKVDISLKHEIWTGLTNFNYQDYIPEMTIYLDVISATAANTTKYAIPTDTTNFIKNIGSVTINPNLFSLAEYENELYEDVVDYNHMNYNPIDGWSVTYIGRTQFGDDIYYKVWIYKRWHESSKTYDLSINIPYDMIQGASDSSVLINDSSGVDLQLRFVPTIKEQSSYWSIGTPSSPSQEYNGGSWSGDYYGYDWGGIAGERFTIQNISLYSYISSQSSNTEDIFYLSSADSVQANIVFQTPVEGEADGWDDEWDLYLTSVNNDGIESAIGESAAKRISNTDVTKCPRIDIITGDFNPNFTGNKFIKGYMTSKRNASYNLQFVIDCEKRTIRSSSSTKEFLGITAGTIIQYSLAAQYLLIPNEIDSYESETGVLIENAIDPKKMIATFKTAVVANNTLYAGNIYQDGEYYPDRMLKSPLGKAPLLPSTNFIDVAVNDGDEIISLQFFKDRLLQFKKDKLFVISTSEDYEYLQDTVENVGISQESQVTKTPYGIAWINERGCYLYDGQKVNNLTDGKLAYKKWKDSESSWEIDEKYGPVIHYLKKEDKLIVYGASDTIENIADNEGGSVQSGGSGNIDEFTFYFNKQYLRELGYQYDFKSKSWTNITSFLENWYGYDMDNVNGRLRLPSGNNALTNFAYDENGDSIFVLKPSNKIFKWDDNPKNTTGDLELYGFSSSNNIHRDFRIITKDYDFTAPSVNKKIYKIYVTFKSTFTESFKGRKINQNQDLYSASNVGVYYAINGTNTWTEFSDTKSKNYGTKGLISNDCETGTTTINSDVTGDNTITLTDISKVKVGYVLTISEEKMLVLSISGNTVTVDRNYTALGDQEGYFSHSQGDSVFISTGDWIVAELNPSSSIN